MLGIFTKYMVVAAIQSEGEDFILLPEWLSYFMLMVRQLWTPLRAREQEDTLIVQRRQYEHTKICFMSG